jgi:signal transduction histidine kinase
MGTQRWHHLLLPGELRDQPDGRRSARDWFVDAMMYVAAIGISALALADTWDAHSGPLLAVDAALGAACLLLLWWRRSHPDEVGLAITVASSVSALAAGPWLIAGFNVALRGSQAAIRAVVLISIIVIQVFPRIYPNGDPYVINVIVGALCTAVVISWGLLVRVRREHLRTLRDRAVGMETEQRLRIEQARDAERRRIAREMHDVLAHRVSLLSLHAGALEFRPDAPPEEIAEAAGVIRANAHAALEELRAVIGVLRDGGAEDDAPEPPQPTLADIPALVDESRGAGMRVSCHLDVPDGLPDALGRTAYRIVQEGLTNARKHAPAAPVEVAVTAADGELVVGVVSRRPVGVAAAGEPLPGAGSGLIGLGERVALAGGGLQHGTDAAGDFILRATLPWTP